MPNRLQKLAIANYTPAVPYQPAVPARCVQVPYQVPGQFVLDGYTKVSGRDGFGNPTVQYIPKYRWVAGHTAYRQVCYPAQPEVRAVPEQTTYTAITGWNSGARSIAALTDDGYVEFSVNAGAFGAVVGLSYSDQSTLPSEQSHAFYVHAGLVDIIEFGRVVAAGVIPHSAGSVYRISRTGQVVTYSVAGWSMISSTPSAGAVVLDASLYASGDYVDNPEIVDTGSSGSGQGYFAPLMGSGHAGAYAEGYGWFRALEGVGQGRINASGSGVFRPLQGVGADRPYAEGRGEFASLDGGGDGGYPQISIATGVGVFSALSGVGIGLTGEIGQGAGSFGPLDGMAADRVYGQGQGTFQALSGGGGVSGLAPNEAFFSSGLALFDIYTPDNLASATFSSGLQIGSSFELVPMDSASFSSVLRLGSIWRTEYAVEAFFSSGLRLGGSAAGAATPETLAGQLAAEPAQYAINVLTGALTRYAAFTFDAFAQGVGQPLYACRPDGVYLMRPGDDDGSLQRAFLDLGATDYGTSANKRLESVYFGINTDGDVTMHLMADKADQSYRLGQQGPMARVKTAKGASGRLWNMALEIDGASRFELDAIEVNVGASGRRIMGRRK